MKTYSCKNCGAVLKDFINIKDNAFKCEYCDSVNYIEKDNTEDKKTEQQNNPQYAVRCKEVNQNGRRYLLRYFEEIK